MKYDDASWHYGGDFPAELPRSAGATHIGMFVAWALLHGLASDIHLREFPEPLAQLRERKITPGQFLIDACDEKFTDEDLSDVGNRFAEHCYERESRPGSYFADYAATVGTEASSIYHVPDTWETFDQLAPVIQQRLEEWLRT